jgi:hypothetical protein
MKNICKVVIVSAYALVAFVFPKSVTVFDQAGVTSIVVPALDCPSNNGGGTGPTPAEK